MSGHSHEDHDEPEDILVPQTITPGGILLGNLAVLGVIWVAITLAFFPFIQGKALIWAGFTTIALLGLLTMNGTFAVDVPDWHGAQIFNPFANEKRRVMFAGFHWKLWWEYIVPDSNGNLFTSLRREVSAEVKIKFATNDPAEKMDVEVLLHGRLDTRDPSPQNDAKRFLRFVSVDDHAYQEMMKADAIIIFGSYYGRNELEDLVDFHKVQTGALSDKDNDTRIHRLGARLGSHIGMQLKKSEPDEQTRNMKQTPARAEALRTAIDKLRENDSSGQPRMTADEARRAALIIDPNSDYTENRNDFNLDIDAKGLENLHDVTFVGGGGAGDFVKGKVKKGGSKK